MAEQFEGKAGKLDMISSLQMKHSQNVEKKVNSLLMTLQKEEEKSDDDWIDYSDEDESEIVNQASKGKEVGKFVSKDEK